MPYLGPNIMRHGPSQFLCPHPAPKAQTQSQIETGDATSEKIHLSGPFILMLFEDCAKNFYLFVPTQRIKANLADLDRENIQIIKSSGKLD